MIDTTTSRMNTYISLSSLAMDLKRVATASYRNSPKVADRFLEEALKRKAELDDSLLKPYVKTLLNKLDDIASETNPQEKAEKALLFSTLFQNASLQLKQDI